MNLAVAVGKRIKDLLFKKGMTQYRLVKITCLNEKTISDIIKGKTTDVKLSTIYLVADALNISLVDFFNSSYFEKDNIDI